jgi:hypothetical protein
MSEPEVYEPPKSKKDHSAGIRWRRRILAIVAFEVAVALGLAWIWMSQFGSSDSRIRDINILLYFVPIICAAGFLALVGIIVRRATFDASHGTRIGIGLALVAAPMVAVIPLLGSGLATPILECAPWSLPGNSDYQRAFGSKSAEALPTPSYVPTLDELLVRVGANHGDVTLIEEDHLRIDPPHGVPIYYRPSYGRVGTAVPNRVLEDLPLWWGPADEAVTWGPREGDFTLTWPGVSVEQDPLCRGRWLLVAEDR